MLNLSSLTFAAEGLITQFHDWQTYFAPVRVKRSLKNISSVFRNLRVSWFQVFDNFFEKRFLVKILRIIQILTFAILRKTSLKCQLVLDWIDARTWEQPPTR